MASLIQSLMSVFSDSKTSRTSILPTTQQDLDLMESQQQPDGYLASDLLNGSYEEIEEEYQEESPPPSDIDLVTVVYGGALHNNHRTPPVVYTCDFYKDFNARLPSNGDSQADVVWRVDIDHPVVIVLNQLMAEPIHRIYDRFGDQLFYRDQDLRAAVNELVSLCVENGYSVSPDPPQQQQEEEAIVI